jgi:hypothetical protein
MASSLSYRVEVMLSVLRSLYLWMIDLEKLRLSWISNRRSLLRPINSNRLFNFTWFKRSILPYTYRKPGSSKNLE